MLISRASRRRTRHNIKCALYMLCGGGVRCDACLCISRRALGLGGREPISHKPAPTSVSSADDRDSMAWMDCTAG